MLEGITLDVTDNLSFSTGVQYQFEEGGMVLTGKGSFQWAQGYKIALSVDAFPLTPETSDLNYWCDNHRISVMLSKEM